MSVTGIIECTIIMLSIRAFDARSQPTRFRALRTTTAAAAAECRCYRAFNA